MEYVTAPRSPEQRAGEHSPFATMLAAADDEANLLLWRGPRSFILLNRFPYNPGHLLVLPNREVANLSDLQRDERLDLLDSVSLGQDVLQRGLQPDGFNIGLNLGRAAGAGVPKHLHFHIVPRWEGDTNFMPVLGQTRVLPEALLATWRKLRTLLPQRSATPPPMPIRKATGTTPPFP